VLTLLTPQRDNEISDGAPRAALALAVAQRSCNRPSPLLPVVFAKCSFLHFLDILKNQLFDFQAFTHLKLRVLW
jgi:hypothetical protein